MTSKGIMNFSASGLTDVGLVRTNNEDRVLVEKNLGLFVIADGMGGHAAGEIASRMAVETLSNFLPPAVDPQELGEDPLRQLAAAVTRADQVILLAATENPNWKGMGTTLTILFFWNGQGYLTHVGDSRIYRLRGDEFTQLSHDHSLVAEQLRQGLISAEEARLSKMKNILTQAVGLGQQLELDQQVLELSCGDRFLLCSDGLSDLVENDMLKGAMTSSRDPEEVCKMLIDKAKEAGGRDNISVVLVEIEML